VRVDDRQYVSRNGELYGLDVELAKQLGYARPADVRKLVFRLVKAKILNDSEVIAIVAQTSTRGGRPALEYWLSESGAIKVAAKSDTPEATRVLDKVILVYREAVRSFRESTRVLGEPAPAAPIAHDEASTRYCAGAVYIGDNPLLRKQMQRAIRWTATRTGASPQKIAGEARRLMKVNSQFAILIDRAEFVFTHLEALASGQLLLAVGPARSDSKQLRMFDS